MDTLQRLNSHGNTISELMFGAPLTRFFSTTNPERYNEAYDHIGVNSVRFTYNVEVGLGSGSGEISTAQAIEYAAARNMPVTLCIETINIFEQDFDADSLVPRSIDQTKVAEIRNFIKTLLSQSDSENSSLPDALIDAIEIGNEYWNGPQMTSQEYGRLVNVLAATIQSVIDELGMDAETAPNILVQMGSPYSPEFLNASADSRYADLSWVQSIEMANLDIINQITDPAARNAIGGLIEHYYFMQAGDPFNFNSSSLSYIDRDLDIWRAHGFSDASLYITEWNNKQGNPSQFGLKGASVMLEMFENMVRLGAVSATVWPFQHNHTRLIDRLTLDENGDPRLTPRGAVFKLMSESLVGTVNIESNLTTSAGYEYELNAYSSDTTYVFFISSRTDSLQSVEIDLSHVVSEYASLKATHITYDPSTADGFIISGSERTEVPLFQDPDALAIISNLTGLGNDTQVQFELGAYEIVQLVYTIPAGQRVTGSDLSETLIGGDGRDTITGGSGDDQLIGGIGADQIFGGSGNDYLEGGRGSDVLEGGLGNDTLAFSSGNETLHGSLGDDTLQFDSDVGVDFDLSLRVSQNLGIGNLLVSDIENVLCGVGDDTVRGSSTNNRLEAGEGRDALYGGMGRDTLFGQGGNDTLYGGWGDDIIDGGAGIDTVQFNERVDLVVNLQVNTPQNTGVGLDSILNIENVISGSGFDRLIGNRSSNLLSSGYGDDKLFGGAGHDTLLGGSGNDIMDGGWGDDLIDGGAGIDTLKIGGSANSNIDLSLSVAQQTGYGLDTIRNVENVIAGSADDFIVGSKSANTLMSGAGHDTLYGGMGNDFLLGQVGNDALYGGWGNDTLDGGAGIDTAYFLERPSATIDLSVNVTQETGAGLDLIRGIENIFTGGGSDVIIGNSQANYLSAGSGNDSVSGAMGHDSLFGEAGNDTLHGGWGNDIIDGGSGVDTIVFVEAVNITITLSGAAAQNTGTGRDTIVNVENVTTGRGSDVLIGNDSANILSSGDGNDSLNGGMGSDTLIGGSGKDVFVFDSIFGSSNVDRVSDFSVSDDVFNLGRNFFSQLKIGALTTLDFTANTSGIATDALDRIIYDIDSGNIFYDADGSGVGGRILFAAVDPNLNLAYNDFFVF